MNRVAETEIPRATREVASVRTMALAGALQETLQQRDDAALNIWQEKRLEIAHAVVKMTDRITTTATASYGVKLLRNAILSIVGQIPFVRHALAEKLSELEKR
jgi:2-polyprenyl-6-methoxyphenol hydroxylase-like FAD-dependent oxidoreductase